MPALSPEEIYKTALFSMRFTIEGKIVSCPECHKEYRVKEFAEDCRDGHKLHVQCWADNAYEETRPPTFLQRVLIPEIVDAAYAYGDPAGGMEACVSVEHKHAMRSGVGCEGKRLLEQVVKIPSTVSAETASPSAGQSDENGARSQLKRSPVPA